MNSKSPAVMSLISAFLIFIGVKINMYMSNDPMEQINTMSILKLCTYVALITYLILYYNGLDLTDDIMLKWE